MARSGERTAESVAPFLDALDALCEALDSLLEPCLDAVIRAPSSAVCWLSRASKRSAFCSWLRSSRRDVDVPAATAHQPGCDALGIGHVSVRYEEQDLAIPTGSVATAAVKAVFRDSDQATFRDYFRRNKVTAKPLPPGIAKNVARGKPLPPGIAKRALPPRLLALAPRVDPDITFSIAGDVVVAMRRDVVVDILRNVFQKVTAS